MTRVEWDVNSTNSTQPNSIGRDRLSDARSVKTQMPSDAAVTTMLLLLLLTSIT